LQDPGQAGHGQTQLHCKAKQMLHPPIGLPVGVGVGVDVGVELGAAVGVDVGMGGAMHGAGLILPPCELKEGIARAGPNSK